MIRGMKRGLLLSRCLSVPRDRPLRLLVVVPRIEARAMTFAQIGGGQLSASCLLCEADCESFIGHGVRFAPGCRRFACDYLISDSWLVMNPQPSILALLWPGFILNQSVV